MEDSLGTFIDSSLMVVLLPVWNLVLLPVLGHYAPNTRKRVGFGSILGVIGILAAAIIAQVDSNKNLVYYMLLPLIIIVIGETFAVVPGTCIYKTFIYQHARYVTQYQLYYNVHTVMLLNYNSYIGFINYVV